MAKPWAVRFYASKAWQMCRDAYIAMVYGQCEKCKGPGYILHHKITLTPQNINDPDISLNHEHLEYLCLTCHNAEHGMGGDIRDGLMFDMNGDLVQSERR